MKFIRLDKGTVKCILTAEEMKEYDLDINDFIEQNEEATDFINILLEKASREVGRIVQSGMATLGVMEMPGGNLSITISDATTNVEEAVNENLKEKFESLLKRIAESGRHYPEEDKESVSTSDIINNLIQDKSSTMISFKSLGNIEEFASSITYGRRIKSDIYKVNGKYILIIYRNKMAEESYVKVCFSSLEFGGTLKESDTFKYILEEHGKLLIEGKALQVMKNI